MDCLTNIDKIKIGSRFRKDMGNLRELADSIAELGMLQPIGLTVDHELIWGHRRLEACRLLGHESIACQVLGMDDIVRGEYAENEIRKGFTVSERVAIGAEVERRLNNRHGSNQYKRKEECHDGDTPKEPVRSDDEAARAVGFGSRNSYRQAKSVVDKGVPELVSRIDSGDIKVSVAADIATLPASDQLAILKKENPGAIRQAAKELNRIQRDIKSARLYGQRMRQAGQMRASPQAPLVEVQDAVAFLEGQEEYDLLLTDPPYSTEVDDIDAFARCWLPLALEKLKPTGRAYVFIGAYPQELLAYLGVARPDQVLVWTYRNTLGPAPKGRYKQNWQAILYYCGQKAPPLDCPELNELFSVHDVSAPDGRQFNREHMWQKPDQLAERFVRHASRPGDLVVDPFCCTGTFLLAAARYGRWARGCDNSLDNLGIALERGCVRGISH